MNIAEMEQILGNYTDLSCLPPEICDIRGLLSVERVKEVCECRPWVIGEVKVTNRNDDLDAKGYDLFINLPRKMQKLIGVKPSDWGYPVQVKSSDKSVIRFLSTKDIFHRSTGKCREDKYIFTFNGQKDKRLLEADIVGQLMLLTRNKISEPEFLDMLAFKFGDMSGVENWIENRNRIMDEYWYSGLLDD